MVEHIVWLSLLILFIAVEASTVGITSIWFAAGALVALLASLFGAFLWLQIVLFFVVSGVLLLFTRPLAKAYFETRMQRTNADRNIGEVGLVTEAVDNIGGTGEVRVGGKRWTARSSVGTPIPEGAQVVIDRIEGVKVFVTPVSCEPAASPKGEDQSAL